MSLHTRVCLLSAYSEQQEFRPDRWLNSCWLDLAWRDVQMFFFKKKRCFQTSLYQSFSLQEKAAHGELIYSSAFSLFFQYDTTITPNFNVFVFFFKKSRIWKSCHAIFSECFKTNQTDNLSIAFLFIQIIPVLHHSLHKDHQSPVHCDLGQDEEVEKASNESYLQSVWSWQISCLLKWDLVAFSLCTSLTTASFHRDLMVCNTKATP